MQLFFYLYMFQMYLHADVIVYKSWRVLVAACFRQTPLQLIHKRLAAVPSALIGWGPSHRKRRRARWLAAVLFVCVQLASGLHFEWSRIGRRRCPWAAQQQRSQDGVSARRISGFFPSSVRSEVEVIPPYLLSHASRLFSRADVIKGCWPDGASRIFQHKYGAICSVA